MKTPIRTAILALLFIFLATTAPALSSPTLAMESAAKPKHNAAAKASSLGVKTAKRVAWPLLKPPPPPPPIPLKIQMGSYNVLGCSHTAGKDARKNFKPCLNRTPAQIGMVRKYGLTLLGLQEFQPPQIAQWRSRMPNWRFYMGRPTDNAVAWDTGTWTFVEGRQLSAKYFGGNNVQFPYVKLKHNKTGQRIWFMSVHNPADTRGNAQALRLQNMKLQSALMKELAESPAPVIFTGDVNDRQVFACPFMTATGFTSANGAVAGPECLVHKMFIDQILASPNLTWLAYVEDWTSKTRRLSDHPLVVATGEIMVERQ